MNYQEKKQRLVAEFTAKLKQGQPISLGKKTSNLFRHRTKGSSAINVSDFNQIISVDKEKLITEVEGMTPYAALVNETLKYGLLPTVVPELKSITIGGAVTGIGIESSSFKYGLVHETITEMEILLPSGEVVMCTPDNDYKDLFFVFPNSYGTLGYLLKLKIKLIPIKRFVELRHHKYSDNEKYFQALAVICAQKEQFDFIDGVIFSEKEMYITTGKFTDHAPFLSDYTYMSIYYKSLRQKQKDYLTVKNYIWRWDTDWFWCSSHFGVQSSKLWRRLWGRKFLNSVTYWKIRAWNGRYKVTERLGKLFHARKMESVVQDVEIPIENCSKFVDFFHQKIGIKPIWVCPTKAYNPQISFPLYALDPDILYINFGFWDIVPATKEKGHYNKLIEKKVEELNGKKSLYSDSYYSKEKFWQLYNKTTYDKLKKKYDPDKKLKDLYGKCVLK